MSINRWILPAVQRTRNAILPVSLALFAITLPLRTLQAETMQVSETCDEAAVHASQQTGVPIGVLRALTRTETGRNIKGRLRPWPWTVNMEGHGKWFNSRDAAMSFAFSGLKSGAQSFDVGCFQINYKWHGNAFASLEDMFDPRLNALYAARFLKSHFVETGDWSAAAGAYHSRTPEYAKKYKTRFVRILALDASEQKSEATLAKAPTTGSSTPHARPNTFPLLRNQDSSSIRMGSLVPIGSSQAGQSWFNLGG